MIQDVSENAGDKKVHVTVVVVISGCRAHRVAAPRHARVFGDVREPHTPFVAKKAVKVLGRVFLEGWDARAVGKKDVRQAVVVVIEGRHSAGHAFYKMFLGSGMILQYEVQPGAVGHIPVANRAERGNATRDGVVPLDRRQQESSEAGGKKLPAAGFVFQLHPLAALELSSCHSPK